MAEEAKKTPEDASQSLEAQSRSLLHSGFDGQLVGRLPPDQVEPSMPIDVVGCSWVRNIGKPACFRKLGTNDKYDHVARFCTRFSFTNSHRASLFFQSSQCYVHDTWLRSTALQLH